MAAVVEDMLYWGAISAVNLGISIAVYGSTKFEQHRRTQSEYSLSTRHIKVLSFPSSFIYLSLATGFLNTCAAYLRFRKIYLLNIPTWPWFATAPESSNPELEKLLEAQWIVAANDWSSLIVGLVFCLAAVFNFATVRQLRRRDRWIKQTLLPVSSAGLDSLWSPTSPKSPDGSLGRARSTSIAFLREVRTTCAKRG